MSATRAMAARPGGAVGRGSRRGRRWPRGGLSLALVLAALLASAGAAGAAPEPPPPGFGGFFFGAGPGLLVARASSRDSILIPVSPSRVESHAAEVLVVGSQVNTEFGYAFSPRFRLLLDTRFTPLQRGGDIHVATHILGAVRLAGPVALRLGLGFEAAEALVEVETSRSAGPGRSMPVATEQQIEGASLSVVAGLEWPISLVWDRLALAITLDAVLASWAIADDDAKVFDDLGLVGGQLGMAVRFFP